AERVELLEERPRGLVGSLDVVGVLGMALASPGADRHDRGEAGGDEGAKELELERLERGPRLGAGRRASCNAEDGVREAAAEEPGEPDREVCDLRGERDVAEVGDP